MLVATKSLHDELKHVMSGLFSLGREKNIDKIEFILSSVKARFLSKEAVRMISDLAHMSKKSSLKHRKAIATSKDECFSNHRMGHFS